MSTGGLDSNSGSGSDVSDARLRVQIGEASAALLRLNSTAPNAAGSLVALVRVIADEAARNKRFANAIAGALGPAAAAGNVVPAPTRQAPARQAPARRAKRAPGPFDPFEVFRDGGEAGLRDKLALLDVDRLKDIIAEHAMDYDKLAMRWRTPSKLQERIVDRVKALSTKGDAFR
ncbi:hypothetical protein EV641_103365 [Rhodococcus sp. SMB37]|uniref:hypothetical protein n=1 Tax=Rhodococcus sp. SMB37 TaxID=2512213 RepID=UPI0010EFEE5C|nr:hypothetical protein [Rhodococcus sp. SMB37]TCN56017.1 hypothetical protein EV641_103365 [Rhodococcus sp. SMB37]